MNRLLFNKRKDQNNDGPLSKKIFFDSGVLRILVSALAMRLAPPFFPIFIIWFIETLSLFEYNNISFCQHNYPQTYEYSN